MSETATIMFGKRTENHRLRQRARLVAGLLALVALPVAATAQITTSERSAAIVDFPLVQLDRSQGVDTLIRLANTTDAPVAVRCFYTDERRRCSNDASVCFDNVDCGEGLCFAASTQLDFSLQLTAHQPLAWLLGSGLTPDQFPFPGFGSNIPPAPGDSFVGWMKCVAVGTSGEPVDNNGLMGDATLYEQTAENLDAAEYGAIGIQAVAGASDGDNTLLIGTEYAGCSNILTFDHFFDGAVDPAADTRSIETTLALMPCSANIGLAAFADPSIQYLIYNEFGERFMLSGTRTGTTARPLSEMDGREPETSPFSVAVAGSLTGKTRVRSEESGIIGIAIEERSDLADPNRRSRAAFNLGGMGTRAVIDTIVLP